MNKEVIRIAQIIGKWCGGGVEAVVMNYYRNINKDKIQFDFICDNDSIGIPYEEIEKLGGKVILIPPYQNAIKYHKQLVRVLREGNYKIAHSHINALSVFSLFAAKMAGVPIRIAHSHSTTNPKEFKKNIMKQILKPFSKLFANHFMCCSESAGKWLFGSEFYEKGRVYLLNNAVDIEKFEFNEVVRKEKRKELGINDDTLVLGHIGRFVETKNHSFIIDVFNEVHKNNDNSILLLIGQGPLMEEIKKKTKKLNIEEYVKFLGQRSDANDLYQTMDIFLFPSLYEGLGMVAVEAQISGCKCIVSTNVPEEVKITDEICFLKTNNPISWKNEILNSKNIRLNYYKEVVNKKFNIKIETLKLEDYYINEYEGLIL